MERVAHTKRIQSLRLNRNQGPNVCGPNAITSFPFRDNGFANLKTIRFEFSVILQKTQDDIYSVISPCSLFFLCLFFFREFFLTDGSKGLRINKIECRLQKSFHIHNR